jgi:hypothetical protein
LSAAHVGPDEHVLVAVSAAGQPGLWGRARQARCRTPGSTWPRHRGSRTAPRCRAFARATSAHRADARRRGPGLAVPDVAASTAASPAPRAAR